MWIQKNSKVIYVTLNTTTKFKYFMAFLVIEAKVPLWKSFSLVYNLKKLATQHSNSHNLDCINGLKVFSMFLIIMGHRLMFSLGSPMVNPDYVESVSSIPK